MTIPNETIQQSDWIEISKQSVIIDKLKAQGIKTKSWFCFK
jgi:hypothetical protein